MDTMILAKTCLPMEWKGEKSHRYPFRYIKFVPQLHTIIVYISLLAAMFQRVMSDPEPVDVVLRLF